MNKDKSKNSTKDSTKPVQCGQCGEIVEIPCSFDESFQCNLMINKEK